MLWSTPSFGEHHRVACNLHKMHSLHRQSLANCIFVVYIKHEYNTIKIAECSNLVAFLKRLIHQQNWIEYKFFFVFHKKEKKKTFQPCPALCMHNGCIFSDMINLFTKKKGKKNNCWLKQGECVVLSFDDCQRARGLLGYFFIWLPAVAVMCAEGHASHTTQWMTTTTVAKITTLIRFPFKFKRCTRLKRRNILEKSQPQ